MVTDERIKQDILDELIWEPSINAAEIGVAVQNGIVSLSGRVPVYAEKIAAEKVAKRIKGVHAVVDEIKVITDQSHIHDDRDIAKAALNSWAANAWIPEDALKLKVENGWLTLEGEVDWNFQRDAAKKVIKDQEGVTGVTNLIRVREKVTSANVKDDIVKAFNRNAMIDASHIDVEVRDHKVILRGKVQSWAEKNQARNAAWASSGVTEVEDHLEVEFIETPVF